MTTLYLVISPNGDIAFAGTEAQRAEFYRPDWDPETGEMVRRGYELFSVEAETPWYSERLEKRIAHQKKVLENKPVLDAENDPRS